MFRIKLRWLIPLLLAAAAVALIRRLELPFSLNPRRPTESVNQADLLDVRRLARLYTSFTLVPVLEIDLGWRKRDWVMDKLPFAPTPDKRIMGGCRRSFEVTFGYENLDALLADEELRGRVCARGAADLPPPAILDVNGVEMQTFGRNEGACAAWDRDRPALEARILEVLRAAGLYEGIEERGRQALGNMFMVLCP